MKAFVLVSILSCIFFNAFEVAAQSNVDSFGNERNARMLPNVFTEPHGDLIETELRQEAILQFPSFQLPATKDDWRIYKAKLRTEIVKKTGALLHQDLALNLVENGSVKSKGFTVKNIAFQTRPGIYATANLYIPEGNEKFPAVIVMMGHSSEGRLYDQYQAVGITLALNGCVSLCIDPWGSGERTTIHGVFEDHGDENNLGIALLMLASH